MKRLLLAALVAVFFVSCAGLSLNPDTQPILERSVARTVGYLIGAEVPEVIPEVTVLLETLKMSDDPLAVDKLVMELSTKLKAHPLIVANLMDLKSLVRIETGEIDMVRVGNVLRGFEEGLLIAGLESGVSDKLEVSISGTTGPTAP